MVETDSPFLARSRTAARRASPRSSPTRRLLANLRGEAIDALAATTTANFFRLFAKAAA